MREALSARFSVVGKIMMVWLLLYPPADVGGAVFAADNCHGNLQRVPEPSRDRLRLARPAFAYANSTSMWETDAKMPVPAGAKVSLDLDRSDYFVGENVLVHFVLRNAGDKPFKASFGGDYRGGSRHLRFNVTATDAAGRLAEDPDPSPVNFGGLGSEPTLKPGDAFTQSLPLMRYCRIHRPGRYTIRVTHDFGWKEEGRNRPVGEAVINFRVPDASQAERIVSEMEKLPTNADASFGKRTRNYADFSCLLHPVYLEPLMRRAGKGDQRALQGIGNIATPEATAALIALAGNADPKLALDAAMTLNGRLPDPEFERKLPSRGPLGSDAMESRRLLSARSWDPKLAGQVRSLATSLLRRSTAAEVGTGAFMIQALGISADSPVVLAAIGRVLEPMVNPRDDPKDNILDLPQPLPELLRAADVLHKRGFVLGDGLSGEEQLLLYFHWLADQPAPRPKRWQELANVFGENSRFPVRETVLRSIPESVPRECVKLVLGRLKDPDLGVCRAACAVAKRSGNRLFLKPLLEIVATEQHEWLLREASDAAQALGAGFDLLVIWVDRLSEEHLYGLALDSLQTVIDGLPGGSSGRTDLTRDERIELRNQWRSFLEKHAGQLRRGNRFRVGDPALSPRLFGRARTWQLPNGNFWPAPLTDIDAPTGAH